MTKTFETDWLASTPVFYNEAKGTASHNINDVIDFDDFEFHAEGFNNFLDFGYSVFGQTPLRDVKFLPHSSRLTLHDDGRFEIARLPDPVDAWLDKTSHEDDAFHLLSSSVNEWEKSHAGEIILPTSGGYDSRLLNLLIEDKARIRSFTYGPSENQADSYEVVYARKISEVLGTRWQHIPLGDFHLHFDEWNKLFGVSTHAHGLYHIEFYNKIRPLVDGGNPFLSGIIGDAWAGSVQVPELAAPRDTLKLGYTHGMTADAKMSLMRNDSEGCVAGGSLMGEYYALHQERLRSPLYRIVEAMRFKLVLLTYLFAVPASFGFKPWSPFLIPEVALTMLTLPFERRKNRVWQQEFFQKHGLNLEAMNLRANYQNSINYQAMRRVRVAPLDEKLLGQIVKVSYVKWINRYVGQQGKLWETIWMIPQIPGIRGALYRMNKLQGTRLKAYYAYLTLKPIENLLKRKAVETTVRT